MTTEEHRQRHRMLHAHLDELIADYITHHPKESTFTQMPLLQFMAWSHQQTIKPDEEHAVIHE